VEASEVQSKLKAVRESVSEVVVGMDDVMEMLLVALLSDGHVLLEGKPGVGKTTMAKTFAKAIGGSYQRIQMTPDLLPSDVLGVNVYNQQKQNWTLRRGPIFGNIILIDELNRSSPKVQSAFLEVMQERQVTIEGQTLLLEKPFMVIATQVPYGEAGTYPLTSVQIDRFAYKVTLGYPEAGEEMEILRRTDLIDSIDIEPTIKLEDVLSMEDQVKMVYVHERVKAYIVDIVNTLRGNRYVRAGPGPRASINLMKGCRVRAMMEGRSYVIPDDVKKLANPTLTHRLELTVQARADETSTERLIQEALGSVEVPKDLKP
jgi:MoxR-like ATPase